MRLIRRLGATGPILTLAATMLVWTSAFGDAASTHYHRAMALKKAGKLDEAIVALKAAIAERDDYAAAHRSLGILWRKKGRHGLAITHLERAAMLQPKSGEVFYSLGLAYHRAGRRAAALTALAKAARLTPKDAQVRAQHGMLLIRVDPERAIVELKAALALEPRSGDYLHQLGLAYRRAASSSAGQSRLTQSKAQMKQAKDYLTQASAFKDTAGLHFDLGVLYRRMEQPFKAIEHYARALELDPKLAAAWWDIGHMYKKTKQYDEAIDAYGHYAKLKGSSKDAKIAHKRIKELKKSKKHDKRDK